MRVAVTSIPPAAIVGLVLCVGCADVGPRARTEDGAVGQRDAGFGGAGDVLGSQDAPSSADTGPQQPVVDIGSMAVELDEAGGVAETDTHGVRLEFPAQALNRVVTITAKPAQQYPRDAQTLPGAVVEFGPDGITFDKPVKVTVAYDGKALPAEISEASLRIFKAVDGQWRAVANSFVDIEHQLVGGELSGFSTYGVRGTCAPNCADKACGTADGCGGICQTGSCDSDGVCRQGQCVWPNSDGDGTLRDAGPGADSDAPVTPRADLGAQDARRADLGPQDAEIFIDPPPPVIDIGTMAVEIDEAGGIAETDTHQVLLEVPAQALSQAVTLTARPAQDYPRGASILPGAVIELGPEGLTFNTPVKLTLAYDVKALPEKITEASLRLFELVDPDNPLAPDRKGWSASSIRNNFVDVERHVVVAELTRAGTYALFGFCRPNCADRACGAADNCGGICLIGSCDSNSVCLSGECVDPDHACEGAACALGQVCQVCQSGVVCTADGSCSNLGGDFI